MLPTCAAVIGVSNLLNSRRDIFTHLLVLAAVSAWAALAALDAGGALHFFGYASKSLPAAGADIGGMLYIVLVRYPCWLAAMFPALPTLLVTIGMLGVRLIDAQRARSRDHAEYVETVAPIPPVRRTLLIVGLTILALALAVRLFVFLFFKVRPR